MTCAVGNDAPSSFSVCNGFVRAAAWERLAGQKVNKKQGRVELYFRRWDRKGREGSRKKTKERQGRGLAAACLDGEKKQEAQFDSIRFVRRQKTEAVGQMQSWDEVEEARKRKKKRLGSG
jgi:hypothetical protein